MYGWSITLFSRSEKVMFRWIGSLISNMRSFSAFKLQRVLPEAVTSGPSLCNVHHAPLRVEYGRGDGHAVVLAGACPEQAVLGRGQRRTQVPDGGFASLAAQKM